MVLSPAPWSKRTLGLTKLWHVTFLTIWSLGTKLLLVSFQPAEIMFNPTATQNTLFCRGILSSKNEVKTKCAWTKMCVCSEHLPVMSWGMGFMIPESQAFQMGMCERPGGHTQGLNEVPWGGVWQTVTGILTHNIWFGFQILCCFVWLLFILLKACLCCFVFILCSVPSLVAWEEDKPSWMFLAVPLLCQVCKGCLVFPSHPCVCQSDLRRQPLDLCLTCVS